LAGIKEIGKASAKLKKIIYKTPLMLNERLSGEFNADIFFKREDKQVVRSYKIRGAYNKSAVLIVKASKRG